MGATPERIARGSDGVAVTLDDGTTETVELLVGADGVHVSPRPAIPRRHGPEAGHVRLVAVGAAGCRPAGPHDERLGTWGRGIRRAGGRPRRLQPGRASRRTAPGSRGGTPRPRHIGRVGAPGPPPGERRRALLRPDPRGALSDVIPRRRRPVRGRRSRRPPDIGDGRHPRPARRPYAGPGALDGPSGAARPGAGQVRRPPPARCRPRPQDGPSRGATRPRDLAGGVPTSGLARREDAPRGLVPPPARLRPPVAVGRPVVHGASSGRVGDGA